MDVIQNNMSDDTGSIFHGPDTDLISLYKNALTGRHASGLTIKNYVADLRHFEKWQRITSGKQLSASSFNRVSINSYSKQEGIPEAHRISQRSMDRHLSSLRSFVKYLETEHLLQENPFTPILIHQEDDLWKIKEFKNYLFNDKCADLTIKNYVIDVQSFRRWLLETSKNSEDYIVKNADTPANIHARALEEYKTRMRALLELSPKTINRKLSAIRRYLSFATASGLLKSAHNSIEPSIPHNAPLLAAAPSGVALENLTSPQEETKQSILEKISAPYAFLEEKTADAVFKAHAERLLGVRAQNVDGDPTASLINQKPTVANIKKEFYAPQDISIESYSLPKKVAHHLKHTRPEWYKRYHNHAIVHYFHFAILVIFATGIGFALFQNLLGTKPQLLFAKAQIPAKSITFQAQLKDSKGSPITQKSTLQFALYNSPTGGTPLYVEARQNVQPNSDGLVSVPLNSIPGDTFTNNQTLFLGVAVNDGQELTPRQQIGAPYAQSADSIQGLVPITQDQTHTRNVLLALDSTGNLTIGGEANPTFAASGGELTLQGRGLVLSTVIGSNQDVKIVPDGAGKIDIQKPLFNSSNYNNGYNTAGAVEIADTLSVTATSSGESALIINQNGYGGLISGRVLGSAKFAVDNFGAITAGTWEATPIGTRFGGLGSDITATSAGELVYSNSSTTYTNLRAGILGQCLTSGGFGKPIWANCPTSSNNFDLASGKKYQINGVDVLSSDTLGSGVVNSSLNSVGTLTSGSIGNGFGDIITSNLIQGSGFNASGTDGSIIFSGTGTHKLVANSGNLQIGDSGISANITIGNASNTTTTISNNLVMSVPDTTLTFSNLTATEKICGTQVDGGGASGVLRDCSGTPGDYAEDYGTQDSSISAGDIVSLDTTKPVVDYIDREGRRGSKAYIVKGSTNTNTTLLGVVSTEPSDVIGKNFTPSENPRPIALSGRVPVKVTIQNGPIKKGDFITASDIPGAGTRATGTGVVVGRALEDYNQDGIGKIFISIGNNWYDPLLSENLYQNYTLDYKSGSFQVTDTFNQIVDKLLVASRGVFGELTAGLITTKRLVVDSDSITIAGQSLKNYIIETVQESGVSVQKSDIVSPLAAVENIQTNIISPLAAGSNISAGFEDSKFIVRNSNSASGSAVASIDNQGNARFAGDLEARRASFSGTLTAQNTTTQSLTASDASISGTLTANHIVANSIDGLEARVATLAANYLRTNQIETPTFQEPHPTVLPDPSSFVDIASFSAQFGRFEQGLLSLGPSTFGDLSIINQLSIGTSFIFSNNAINTLGTTLEIQPLRQGSISFLAGSVVIDINGNLIVGENAVFAKNLKVKGILSANIISPLPDQDLVINLESSASSNSALTHDSSFIIHNSSASAVFAVNNRGDVRASGSATFAKLNLSLVAPAYATGEMTAVATGSAGTAILKAGRPELTILNPHVTDTSLIYIMPTGNTQSQTLYLLRQAANQTVPSGIEGSFTVGVNGPATQDVQFNWLIIN